MARRAREEGVRREGLAAAVLASVSTLVLLAFISAYVSTDVLRALVPSLACGLVALLGTAALLLRRGRTTTTGATAADQEQPVRPFAFRPALLLALVLTAALFLGRWGAETFGGAGAITVSGLAGLADAHAGALAAAQLAATGQIPVSTAVLAVSAALATNTALKLLLAFAAGGVQVGLRYAALMVVPVLAYAAPLVVAAV